MAFITAQYLLPDGRIVAVDASAAKGALLIDYTLADGAIVQAIREKADRVEEQRWRDGVIGGRYDNRPEPPQTYDPDMMDWNRCTNDEDGPVCDRGPVRKDTHVRTVLVVDQCYPLSPYALQQHPVAFDQLLREVAAQEAEQPYYGRRPQVLEVDDDYRPRWATSVFAADDQGMAILWRSQWDST